MAGYNIFRDFFNGGSPKVEPDKEAERLLSDIKDSYMKHLNELAKRINYKFESANKRISGADTLFDIAEEKSGTSGSIMFIAVNGLTHQQLLGSSKEHLVIINLTFDIKRINSEQKKKIVNLAETAAVATKKEYTIFKFNVHHQ